MSKCIQHSIEFLFMSIYNLLIYIQFQILICYYLYFPCSKTKQIFTIQKSKIRFDYINYADTIALSFLWNFPRYSSTIYRLKQINKWISQSNNCIVVSGTVTKPDNEVQNFVISINMDTERFYLKHNECTHDKKILFGSIEPDDLLKLIIDKRRYCKKYNELIIPE